MESTGLRKNLVSTVLCLTVNLVKAFDPASKIQLSETTANHLKNTLLYEIEPRGTIEIKVKKLWTYFNVEKYLAVSLLQDSFMWKNQNDCSFQRILAFENTCLIQLFVTKKLNWHKQNFVLAKFLLNNYYNIIKFAMLYF